VKELERLCADGLLRREGDGYRTTAKWQAAMARSALWLSASDHDGRDLRVPIAAALVEVYGEIGDEALAALIESMLPVEARELVPSAPRSV
jgi:hypothetical protein